MLLIADALATWTEWLAFATFAAAALALIGLGWSIWDAGRERKAVEDRLKDQRQADDARANQQIAAAREDAERQVAAAQERLEAQRAADDARAERQIEAAREAAQRQVAEMQQQLDAANRPLLIEVAADGPVYPDMAARPNPAIRPGTNREIPLTTAVGFGSATVEMDPRATYVSFEGGFARLSVALRNVGRGLAVLNADAVTLEGDDLGAVEWRATSRERVPPNESTRVSLTFRYPPGLDIPSTHPPSEVSPWSLFVLYTDFVGRQPAYAHVRLSRESTAGPSEGWVILSVDQIPLEEFFTGRSDSGREVRVYAKNTGHESMLDVEGNPFEVVRRDLWVATVDGKPLDVQRLSVQDGIAALIVTPTDWVTATAPDADHEQARNAVARLAAKAPPVGWQIECLDERTDEKGTRTFILRVSNEIASEDVSISLPADVADTWEREHSAGQPLRDIIVAEAQRQFRGWSLSRIKDRGSQAILAGRPLA